MYDFRGKVALVTGASRMRSIGHATALRFAKEGADVVITSRHRPPEEFPDEEKTIGWKGIDSITDEIEKEGVRALAITADISQRNQAQDVIEEALVKFGRIDFLVCNAAILTGEPILEIREESWHSTMAVNLDGVFYCCQSVARHMIERGGGGAIVNVSSRAGKMGVENRGAYCASKFGVNGFTQVLAIELGSYDIRVNAVCPGHIITNLTRGTEVWNIAREKQINMMEAAKLIYSGKAEQIPLRRFGYPEEVANVICFLCSNEASFITGQCININGGHLTAY